MAQRGRPALRGISLVSLQAEVDRRQRAAKGLLRVRERLMRRLEALDAKLGAAGLNDDSRSHGAARRPSAGSGRRRPRNEMNLVEALAKVLDGKTLSVTEACEAVQQAGYRTSSKTFRVIVNQTLLKSPRFRKIARGQYTLKK